MSEVENVQSSVCVQSFDLSWSSVLMPLFQQWLVLENQRRPRGCESASPCLLVLRRSHSSQSSCLSLSESNCICAIYIETLHKSFNVFYACTIFVFYLKQTSMLFMLFKAILYFNYRHFISSWNQISILCWKWILIFVSFICPIWSQTLRLYCIYVLERSKNWILLSRIIMQRACLFQRPGAARSYVRPHWKQWPAARWLHQLLKALAAIQHSWEYEEV